MRLSLQESSFIVPSGTPDTNFVCKVTFASGDSEEKIVTFDSFGKDIWTTILNQIYYKNISQVVVFQF